MFYLLHSLTFIWFHRFRATIFGQHRFASFISFHELQSNLFGRLMSFILIHLIPWVTFNLFGQLKFALFIFIRLIPWITIKPFWLTQDCLIHYHFFLIPWITFTLFDQLLMDSFVRFYWLYSYLCGQLPFASFVVIRLNRAIKFNAFWYT